MLGKRRDVTTYVSLSFTLLTVVRLGFSFFLSRPDWCCAPITSSGAEVWRLLSRLLWS